MVLSHRVYSTHNPRKQVCVPRTQKEYLEQHLIKKRNAERDRLEYWSGTCKYYDKVDKQNAKFNELVSDQSKRTSLDAFMKIDESDRKRMELEERRSKLRNLLETEKQQWNEELKLLPRETMDVKDLREIRDMFRKEKEKEQKAEAELRMLQHWKLNHPQIREVESARNERLAFKYLELQIKERKEEEDRLKREQEEHEREVERRRLEEEAAAARAEEERRVRLEEWRRELDSQLEELRGREREVEQLERRRVEEEEMQREADRMKEESKKVEKLREERELKTAQKQQHALQLKKRSEAVEADLAEDRRRIDKMLRMVELQERWDLKEKERCLKEVRWMQQVLEHQKTEEDRRRQEMELLFAEEAEKMWKKQQEVWDREDRARKRLMEEVSEAWNKQIQERVAAAQAAEKQSAEEKNQVEMRIRDLKQFIQNEEINKQKKREALVQGLDEGLRAAEEKKRQVRFQEEFEDTARRKQEINEEVKLARYLSESLNVEEEPPIRDFRRRKVRWFY